MFVLGIDEATAQTCLHVDQVEFDDTGDVTPVLLIQILTGTLFRRQFQVYARSQGHLVEAATVVAGTIFDML